MRIYPKKLHSIDEVEREKKLVQARINAMDKEDIFSMKNILGGSSDEEDTDSGDGIMSLLSMLPISNPLVSMGAKVVQGFFAARRKNKSTQESGEKKKQGKDKNILRSLAVEVLGGYLKWKAIELSYKGARNIIKKRRERRDED